MSQGPRCKCSPRHQLSKYSHVHRKPDEIQTLAALTACDDGRSKIIWHWQFGAIGDDKGDVPVRGFTLLSLVHDDGPAEWKVERIDVEFDSIAWASNADSKH